MTKARAGLSSRGASTGSNGLLAARSVTIGFSRLLMLGLSTAYAAPLTIFEHYHDELPEEDGASLWVLYVTSLVLVLLGGAFAGLTIALMGQDGIYLQVVATDPSEPQQKNARRVYDLLQKGKHWVLVTLLLANVIVNETLPVVLDRCLGGGVAAVVGSTFLIVIFGEILPQSVCVRYGLQIGGYMSKPVLALMYLTSFISWPIAKLLDKLLGEDHGTVYKKSGLKTLVTLHRDLGGVSERLNQDEVTIISAVLDLKEKPVANVMTPMDDVFVMSEDTVLDEETMDMILSAGYSRIPIHENGNPTNFVGMLLVKILITYDPEDCKLVREFPLATLPETRPETSCLDIVNFFQEGKSHMVLVSEFPGEDHGALGVVTLEDVIEELIGEEIIDESDVYIDVHKAIRRLAPAPKARVQRQLSEDHVAKLASDNAGAANYGSTNVDHDFQSRTAESTAASVETAVLSSSPKPTTFMMRRSSAGLDGHPVKTTIPIRANFEELKQHLKHLGPSNPATNPKNTRSTTVKVKPGIVTVGPPPPPRPASIAEGAIGEIGDTIFEGDETTNLLGPASTGKDGIQALRQTYGSVSPANEETPTLPGNATPKLETPVPKQPAEVSRPTQTSAKTSQVDLGREASAREVAAREGATRSNASDDSIHSRRTDTLRSEAPKRGVARSGSITENVIESRGVRKVVLETTSSNDEDEYTLTITPEHTKQNKSSSSASLLATGVPEVEEDEDGAASPTTGDENAPGLSTADSGLSGGEAGTGGTSRSGTAADGGGGARNTSSSKKKVRRKKRRGGRS
ncbi:hypothetical protein B0T17DRAFT_592457 [Bombardia bombarda]|uniref:Uncharacterized protein n=1 Tax=Bombardia bombarda TaxID=252184 RepID=A0AA40BW19_9PEZI|nr:hypothetical protein B0T17DRAFT_592457 [Bombardia bombarda]